MLVLGNLCGALVHRHHSVIHYFVNRPAGLRGEHGVGVADEIALGAVRAQLVPVARRREEAHRLARLWHHGVGQQVTHGVGHLHVAVDLRMDRGTTYEYLFHFLTRSFTDL